MLTNALTVADILIHQDAEGRYCLNDLHKAAGALSKDQPSKWLILDSAQQLVKELDTENLVADKNQSVKKYMGGGGRQGTYVFKELVYAYAMWISPVFHLKVIRAYDALVTQGMLAQSADFSSAAMLTTEQYEAERARLNALLEKLQSTQIAVMPEEYERLTGERIKVGKRTYLTTQLVGVLEDCGVPRETIQSVLGADNNYVRQYAFRSRKNKTH